MFQVGEEFRSNWKRFAFLVHFAGSTEYTFKYESSPTIKFSFLSFLDSLPKFWNWLPTPSPEILGGITLSKMTGKITGFEINWKIYDLSFPSFLLKIVILLKLFPVAHWEA